MSEWQNIIASYYSLTIEYLKSQRNIFITQNDELITLENINVKNANNKFLNFYY